VDNDLSESVHLPDLLCYFLYRNSSVGQILRDALLAVRHLQLKIRVNDGANVEDIFNGELCSLVDPVLDQSQP
jgi:hypothetical protein